MATPPNFLIFLTDDQGYQDVGCFGSPFIETPHLDRLAEDGTRLTACYAAASTCTPARAALLTGQYAARLGLAQVVLPDRTRPSFDQRGMPATVTTLPEILQQNGYRTALVGKWHLGHYPEFHPLEHGFEEFFGLPYSNDIVPPGQPYGWERYPDLPLYDGREVIEVNPDQSQLTQRYTKRAVALLDGASDEPFFLLVAYAMPHVPLAASEAFAGRSERGLYGDTIEEIDASVGTILDHLEQSGLAENTVVLFTSDNGPWLRKGPHGGSAFPLRGGKGSTHEGGFRVPTILRAPGVTQPGSTVEVPVSFIDVLPTFCAMADVPLPNDRALDGVDVTVVLRGDVSAALSQRSLFYINAEHTVEAIRHGPWKYCLTRETRANGKTRDVAELYHLPQDPGERNNLVLAQPERAMQLRTMLETFAQTLPPVPEVP